MNFQFSVGFPVSNKTIRALQFINLEMNSRTIVNKFYEQFRRDHSVSGILSATVVSSVEPSLLFIFSVNTVSVNTNKCTNIRNNKPKSYTPLILLLNKLEFHS